MSAPCPGLDFSDPAAIARWLGDLYDRFGDVDAVVTDMLAPPEARELGPVFHAGLYGDARGSILDAFSFAGVVTEPDEDEAPLEQDPDATPVPSGELDADEPPWAPGGKP